MVAQQDKNDLLDALVARGQASGKRPSVWEAQMNYLPEWDRDRLFDTAQALLDDGVILNPVGPLLNVDIASSGRKQATARAMPSPMPATTINNYSNSNVQNVASGAHGVQNNIYNQQIKNELQSVIDIYRQNVDSLGLDISNRRRADAQVATLEAQIQDEPNPVIVNAAGKSLRTIVEAAIGGALGNAMANPRVWAGLLALFN